MIGRRRRDVIKVHTDATAAAFLALLVPRVIDKNPPHGFGGSGKEMAAAVPQILSQWVEQTQVGFVNQRRRFERLPRFFLGQLLRSQFAKLIVNERKEVFRGMGIALGNRVQYPRKFLHAHHGRTSFESGLGKDVANAGKWVKE